MIYRIFLKHYFNRIFKKFLAYFTVKFWKKKNGNTRLPDLPPKKSVCRSRATVRTGHGTTDWFKIGKGVSQVQYCHPAYLTYMVSRSWEMLDCMRHKLESRLPGEISITSDMHMTLMVESEELKSLLMKVKEESEKAGLKLRKLRSES